VEVGTTNRTRVEDYERAIGPDTAALMRVHPSNFRAVGFTEEADVSALGELAARHNLALIDDIGSGVLAHGSGRAAGLLASEPAAADSVAAGASVVCFSADKLLGGHGSDHVEGRGSRDVIWGDRHADGQPTTQLDVLEGGAGADFIYASHGRNTIRAGDGDDYVKAHWGRGSIDCGSGRDVLYVSRRAQPHYRIRHCDRISHRTLGY
jgi:hypothetical protein